MSPRPAVLAALLVAALAFEAHVRAQTVSLADPAGDDRGPGGYEPPTGSDYRPGDFDLRGLEIRVDGDEAIIDVALGARVRRDVVAERTNAADLDLSNGIYVQNVDVYIDTDPSGGATAALPGRRVGFSPDEGWDVAVVFTPLPHPTRRILDATMGAAARRVILVEPVRTVGRRLEARVPLSVLGGAPAKAWGYQVLVTGAVWQSSFDAFDHVLGRQTPDAFTMPVLAVPEESAFGGGRLGDGHPQVIDCLVPPGLTQAGVLGAYDATHLAIVPMVYPDPQAHTRARQAAAAAASAPVEEKAPAPSEAPVANAAPAAVSPAAVAVAAPRPSPESPGRVLEYRIMDLDGDTAVIPTPDGTLEPWQLGTVVDDEGRGVGRVVVTTVSKGFVLATVAPGGSGVKKGARVRFDSKSKKESEKER